MPKIATDYSKCIVYKIVCNDLNVTDCYVGHTTSFKHRKAQHKNCCGNEKSKRYNLKVYQIIRANGDWENWSMVEIEKYPCKDNNEACARERFWFEKLKANLNSCVPNRTFKEYRNKYYQENQAKIKENNKNYYQENQSKITQKFNCECGGKYLYSSKSQHLKSKKHLNFISSNNKDAETVTENKEIEPI